MAVFIRPKDGSLGVIPMHVMGDFMEGEFVLNEMLKGDSLSSIGLTHRDFVMEERSPIILDPGGFAIIGPGRDVFTLQGERFMALRTKLGYLIGIFNSDLQERVTGFFRVGQMDHHVFIPTIVRDGMVRKLRRLATEFETDENTGSADAPECRACERDMVRESPPVGAAFWSCEKCTRAERRR